MRILGAPIKLWKEEMPHFRCYISGEAMHIPTHVLLDTGSPFTVITPKDFLRTRLSLLDGKTQGLMTCKLAGFTFYRKPIATKITYRFLSEEDKVIEIEYPNAEFLIPAKREDVDAPGLKSIPSIIGVDFLRYNDFTFTFNPNKKIVYLEK